MNAQSLDRCLAFVQCQLQPNGRRRADALPKRAVTISRQAGCGARAIGEKLAELLQAKAPHDHVPWTVFDRNLVERVLEDHNLPSRLARFMPEDRISAISDTMDDLFGLHPPSWILVRQTAETILHLAELGSVILIGRAANIITSNLSHMLHIRLVGSLEKRLAHIQEFDHLDEKAAREFVTKEDAGRKRYLRKYFHVNIEDPLHYHLVINTDLVPHERAARLICDVMLNGHRETAMR